MLPDHVFVLGDNRDDSQDSCFGLAQSGYGQVLLRNIKGLAGIIWMSFGGGHGIRFPRLFTAIP